MTKKALIDKFEHSEVLLEGIKQLVCARKVLTHSSVLFHQIMERIY